MILLDMLEMGNVEKLGEVHWDFAIVWGKCSGVTSKAFRSSSCLPSWGLARNRKENPAQIVLKVQSLFIALLSIWIYFAVLEVLFGALLGTLW